MADIVDLAMTYEEMEREKCIEAARHQIPPLQTGYCIDCGDQSETLRTGCCTECRTIKEQRAGRYAGY